MRIANPAMIERTAMVSPKSVGLHPSPPQGKLKERTHNVKTLENGIELQFLNRVRQLRKSDGSIDWRPEELKTGTRLWLLNLHYTEFLEGLPADEAGRVILDWIRQVKPFEQGYWLDNWNSYSLSIRVVVWMQQLAARDLVINMDEKDLIKGSLIAQIRFLRKNLELDICGNHLIKNIKALLWASAFFDDKESEQWSALGLHLLRRELKEQILADGMHFELSPTYHNQVFADLLDCYTAMKDTPERNSLGHLLDKMAQVSIDFCHPDGGVSLFNDCGLYFAYTTEDCLSAYEKLRNKSVSPKQHIALEKSGYYGLRSNNDLFLVDCAELAPKYLPAHGHGDALSFEWSINGQRIFVDAGVYEYNPGTKRAYSRATSSHNTVNLDGKDQSEFWKAFRVGRRAHISYCNYKVTKKGFKLTGSHDGYTRLAGTPIHTRRFDVAQDTVTIEDEIRGGNGQLVQAVLLLHPDMKVKHTGKNKLLVYSARLEVEITASAPIKQETSNWHPDQGMTYLTTKLTINYGTAPCQGKIRIVKLKYI